MAMKFKVEQKGERFLVVNETTGYVKGRFKDKGEAQVHCDKLQQAHQDGLDQISSRTIQAPPEE